MAMICCVCESEIATDQEHWANAWEKTRRRFACCSSACAEGFHPDAHWIPSSAPASASEPESDRLIGVLRTRLSDGDSPSVVTRELLLAGVKPDLIRGILFYAQSAGAKSRREAGERTALGVVSGIFTGLWSFGINRDKRDPKTFDAAFVDLERWRAAMETRAPA
ncbi:MAG: hypothetical protein ACXVCV_04645 [Polyangia bacterium]